MSYRDMYASLLEAIARDADVMALKYFRQPELVVERKNDGSAVTQADKGIEEMAREKVDASGLPLDVLGEEMGGESAKSPAKTGRPRLIIDPIDGTEEFSRGIPTFGTLLGIESEGEIVAGLVSAPGFLGGLRWYAYKGEGAYCNGRRIRVSQRKPLSHSMIFTTGTGAGKDPEARASLRRAADAARNSRSIGGFWQHMLVAEGAIEAAVDWVSKPWDLAPLGIIVEEAGGRSTTIDGERTIYKGRYVSSNGLIHEEVLAALRG